jgi:hypothetical protein
MATMRTLLACLLVLLSLTTAAANDLKFLNERHAYVRGETLTLRLTTGAGEEVAFAVSGWLPRQVPVARGEARYEVDTSLLHAGDYEVRAQPLQADRPVGAPAFFPISIAPPRNPQRFPVWNWGGAEDPDLSWWSARGFNGLRLSSTRDPIRGKDRSTAQIFDEGARLGLDIGAYLYPLLASRWGREEPARCVLLDGTRDPRRVYPREPIVLAHARRTAEAWVEQYGEYPSFRHALLNSEYQVPFCGNEEVRTLAKREAGLEPDEVLRTDFLRKDSASLDVAKLPPDLRPRDGLIPDDHPVARFLKWWWERGHGTSVLNAEMARIIKAGKPDVMTWHDPYRLAPVYHTHQGLDIISTWTYGHPDIKRLGYTTVLEAAAKRDHQKVMQTITLYLYSRFVMSVERSTAQPLADRAGRDAWFNAGPDFVREAMWLVLSQRPDLLGFYYPGASRPSSPNVDPYVSSPETFDAIGEVCRSLVEPYGPTILQCRRLRPRVAVLNSATSLWFQGAPLWYSYANEQILPYCALLMMNHVPFDVLLDDDIAAGRLDDYEVLVIPRGDTLTRGVHERIVEFARTRKVIANKTMRAKVPGAAVTDFDFTFERAVDGNLLPRGQGMTAEEHRSRMEAYADQLQPLLADRRGPADTESKRVLINTLESGDLRYVFLVNDDRTYGPRFGAWKLQFETGLRQTAKVRLTTSGVPALYDAIAKRLLGASATDGKAEFDVTLPAALGKIIAILPERIGRVGITTPPKIERGQPYPIGVSVLGVSGRPLRGALPVRVQITDPLGRENEFSRYAAIDGDTWTLPFLAAMNDPAGVWTIRVTELLGGSRAEQSFPLP